MCPSLPLKKKTNSKKAVHDSVVDSFFFFFFLSVSIYYFIHLSIILFISLGELRFDRYVIKIQYYIHLRLKSTCTIHKIVLTYNIDVRRDNRLRVNHIKVILALNKILKRVCLYLIRKKSKVRHM